LFGPKEAVTYCSKFKNDLHRELLQQPLVLFSALLSRQAIAPPFDSSQASVAFSKQGELGRRKRSTFSLNLLFSTCRLIALPSGVT